MPFAETFLYDINPFKYCEYTSNAISEDEKYLRIHRVALCQRVLDLNPRWTYEFMLPGIDQKKVSHYYKMFPLRKHAETIQTSCNEIDRLAEDREKSGWPAESFFDNHKKSWWDKHESKYWQAIKKKKDKNEEVGLDHVLIYCEGYRVVFEASDECIHLNRRVKKWSTQVPGRFLGDMAPVRTIKRESLQYQWQKFVADGILVGRDPDFCTINMFGEHVGDKFCFSRLVVKGEKTVLNFAQIETSRHTAGRVALLMDRPHFTDLDGKRVEPSCFLGIPALQQAIISGHRSGPSVSDGGAMAKNSTKSGDETEADPAGTDTTSDNKVVDGDSFDSSSISGHRSGSVASGDGAAAEISGDDSDHGEIDDDSTRPAFNFTVVFDCEEFEKEGKSFGDRRYKAQVSRDLKAYRALSGRKKYKDLTPDEIREQQRLIREKNAKLPEKERRARYKKVQKKYHKK